MPRMSDPHPILDHELCTVRLHNWIHCAYEEPISTSLIKEHIIAGKLHPSRTYGYGKKMHQDLCNILGVDIEATRPVMIQPHWKFHPITGKPINQPH